MLVEIFNNRNFQEHNPIRQHQNFELLMQI